MSNRDWVNSPAHISRVAIDEAQTQVIAAIIAEDKKLYEEYMAKLRSLYV